MQPRHPLEVVVERPGKRANFVGQYRDEKVRDGKTLSSIGRTRHPFLERPPRFFSGHKEGQSAECASEGAAVGLRRARPELEADRKRECDFVRVKQTAQ